MDQEKNNSHNEDVVEDEDMSVLDLEEPAQDKNLQFEFDEDEITEIEPDESANVEDWVDEEEGPESEQPEDKEPETKEVKKEAPTKRVRTARKRASAQTASNTKGKQVILIVTGVLLLGLIASFFYRPTTPNSNPRPLTFKDKLKAARQKAGDGADLMNRAEKRPDSRSRNALLRRADRAFRKSLKIYDELIEKHQGAKYKWLDTEASNVQRLHYHCLKMMTIDPER